MDNNNEASIKPLATCTPLAEFLLPEAGVSVFVVPAAKLVCVPPDPDPPFVAADPLGVVVVDAELDVIAVPVGSTKPNVPVTVGAAALAHGSMTHETASGASTHFVPVLLGVRLRI
jgi:hypothetical protein